MDARTMPMWQELAQLDDLPPVAVPAVVHALVNPVSRFHDFGGLGERWRQEAFSAALPQLMSLAASPGLRARLIKTSSRDEIVTLIASGSLTANSLAAVIAVHGVWPELIAALASRSSQLPSAIDLLDSLTLEELASVLSWWRLPGRDSAASDIPTQLAEAVCHRLFAPLAGEYMPPRTYSDWVRRLVHGHGGWLASYDDAPWRILEALPDRWEALAADPRFGRWVQHLLLEHADTALLGDRLLSVCLPVATCAELTGLPHPGLTARARLRRLAHRARRHPRLLSLASDDMHAAAADCVVRGQLLRTHQTSDRRVLGIAEDLAVVSSEPRHLAKAVMKLAALPQPTLITGLPSLLPANGHIIEDTAPHRFIEHCNEHHRAQALAQVAANPATPRPAVTAALAALHPAELAWISHSPVTPLWCARAAASVPVPDGSGILWILSDQELDTHPVPATILQSWLDGRHTMDSWARERLHSVVLRSRHCTDGLLRQLPAHQVLASDSPRTAARVILAFCGTSPARWMALVRVLDSRLDDAVTFGELLNRIARTPPQGHAEQPDGGENTGC